MAGMELFYGRLHPDDRERTQAAIETAIQSQRYDIEYRTVSRDGGVRWIHSIGQCSRNSDGKPVRLDGVTIDVTSQKAVEAERDSLLQAEQAARLEAERSGRMKDEFLATLSHELRTPLSSILGWAHVLRKGKTLGEELEKGLETIERNARSQAQIIEDLLDMSRIISGKVRLEVELIDVRPVVESAIDTIRHAAEAKGVKVSTAFDSKPHAVSGDPSRLQQVFWNLLSNAVKFTPRDGLIEIALKEVGPYVEITVSDTGAGIDPAFMAHVFSRFRQADGSTTRRHGGLGLGLAIVKQLVELHGGTVQARSDGEGKGSAFVVTLPLASIHRTAGSDDDDEPTHHTTILSSSPIVSLSGTKILILEDEDDARELLARVLEEYGAQVIKQPSALHAVELLLGERPDIIISDIGMPVEDGYSFIRRVRSLADERARAVPAIALTAYARSEDRVKAFLAGFQMHLAKPLETAELVTVVSNLCHQDGRS
jgi:signal transduction histidine kinase/ActR/RegA family two-component response regulator